MIVPDNLMVSRRSGETSAATGGLFTPDADSVASRTGESGSRTRTDVDRAPVPHLLAIPMGGGAR